MKHFALLAVLVLSIVICPDHGVQAYWTGNKKFAQGHAYCEYTHPMSQGGVHRFWQLCD